MKFDKNVRTVIFKSDAAGMILLFILSVTSIHVHACKILCTLFFVIPYEKHNFQVKKF